MELEPPGGQKRILDALLSRFSWPVEEEFMCDSFEVVTDPARQKHVVLWPRENSRDMPPFTRYLHEMGHALLAETAHQQFSRPFFVRGTDPALRNTYSAVFDTALDWYVQELLMDIAPKIQGDDIDRRFTQTARMLREGAALPSVEFTMDAGLALATFQHLRGLAVKTQGRLHTVTQAFLRAAPDKPSLFTLQSLARRLVEASGMHTASLKQEKSFEHWQIKPLTRG